MSPRRAKLLQQGLAQFGIAPQEIDTLAPASKNPREWFGTGFAGRVFLEVGFGGGEHLLATARDHPDDGFIGAEVYQGGLANCCALLDAEKLENLRLFAEDARRLLAVCADASLAGAFVLFPDPWPKRRHAKRRLVSRPFLDELARVLCPGAELRVASDDPACQVALLAELLPHTGFAWCEATADHPAARWSARPKGWHPTRYEAKALASGRKPIYLTFTRL